MAEQLQGLWNAADNDSVRYEHGGSGGNKMNKNLMKKYAWAGESRSARKSALAAIKCTGLVNGIRMAALSTPDM
jgi:hypothetical protein